MGKGDVAGHDGRAFVFVNICVYFSYRSGCRYRRARSVVITCQTRRQEGRSGGGRIAGAIVITRKLLGPSFSPFHLPP